MVRLLVGVAADSLSQLQTMDGMEMGCPWVQGIRVLMEVRLCSSSPAGVRQLPSSRSDAGIVQVRRKAGDLWKMLPCERVSRVGLFCFICVPVLDDEKSTEWKLTSFSLLELAFLPSASLARVWV